MPAARDVTYTRRVVDDELDQLASQLIAIALEGPKGVGKTATATRRAATIHRLDDPAQREIAAADPQRLLEGPYPVLIDEWQELPEIWDVVRRAVDDPDFNGSILLTGSAMPPAESRIHSGAGRIVSVRMRPLSLFERGLETPTVSLAELLRGERPPLRGRTAVRLEDYVKEILSSGFPGLRHLDDRALRAQLDGYIRRIIDHDFEHLGHQVRNPAALERWLRAYAAGSSGTASWETIRDAATGGEGDKPARSTILPYRDILQRLWILDPLLPWLPTGSQLARLGMSEKHQLADPALATRLLGVGVGRLLEQPETSPLVRDGTLLGNLFESLVSLDVRVYAAAAEANVYHLRTSRGDHEIDLIVDRGDGRVVAIEVKLARDADKAIAHLKWLADRIGDNLVDAIVITTGSEAYRRRDGIGVVPAALLGP